MILVSPKNLPGTCEVSVVWFSIVSFLTFRFRFVILQHFMVPTVSSFIKFAQGENPNDYVLQPSLTAAVALMYSASVPTVFLAIQGSMGLHRLFSVCTLVNRAASCLMWPSHTCCLSNDEMFTMWSVILLHSFSFSLSLNGFFWHPLVSFCPHFSTSGNLWRLLVGQTFEFFDNSLPTLLCWFQPVHLFHIQALTTNMSRFSDGPRAFVALVAWVHYWAVIKCSLLCCHGYLPSQHYLVLLVSYSWREAKWAADLSSFHFPLIFQSPKHSTYILHNYVLFSLQLNALIMSSILIFAFVAITILHLPWNLKYPLSWCLQMTYRMCILNWISSRETQHSP